MMYAIDADNLSGVIESLQNMLWCNNLDIPSFSIAVLLLCMFLRTIFRVHQSKASHGKLSIILD